MGFFDSFANAFVDAFGGDTPPVFGLFENLNEDLNDNTNKITGKLILKTTDKITEPVILDKFIIYAELSLNKQNLIPNMPNTHELYNLGEISLNGFPITINKGEEKSFDFELDIKQPELNKLRNNILMGVQKAYTLSGKTQIAGKEHIIAVKGFY